MEIVREREVEMVKEREGARRTRDRGGGVNEREREGRRRD